MHSQFDLVELLFMLVTLGLVIPFEREMNAINIQCDLRLFGNASNSNAPKKREPRNPENTACLKTHLNHLNIQQIGNERTK